MPKEKNIVISSLNRVKRNDTSTNFTVHVSNSSDIHDVNRIIVKSVTVPNLFGNVFPSNNKMYIRRPSGIFEVTIPVGRYDVDTFTTTLSNALDTQLDVTLSSMTVDPTTGQITFVFSDTVEILSSSRINAVDSLNRIVGGDVNVSTIGTTVTMPGVIDLSGPTNIHVHSASLAPGTTWNSRGDNMNMLCVVPLTSEYGSIEHYRASDHLLEFVDVDDADLSNISILLTDARGNQLILPVNADIEIRIMAVY